MRDSRFPDSLILDSPIRITPLQIGVAPLDAILDDLDHGIPAADIALRFHVRSRRWRYRVRALRNPPASR